MTDQHREELLNSSAAYTTARLAFMNAIVAAQGAGLAVEEIAHVTGLSPWTIEAVLNDPA